MLQKFAKSHVMRACVPTWSTCQLACVPMWFTCQRAIRLVNFSTSRPNVLKGVPIFQTFF